METVRHPDSKHPPLLLCFLQDHRHLCHPCPAQVEYTTSQLSTEDQIHIQFHFGIKTSHYNEVPRLLRLKKQGKIPQHSLKTVANGGNICREKTRIKSTVSLHCVPYLQHILSFIENLRGKRFCLAHKEYGVNKETENET